MRKLAGCVVLVLALMVALEGQTLGDEPEFGCPLSLYACLDDSYCQMLFGESGRCIGAGDPSACGYCSPH